MLIGMVMRLFHRCLEMWLLVNLAFNFFINDLSIVLSFKTNL